MSVCVGLNMSSKPKTKRKCNFNDNLKQEFPFIKKARLDNERDDEVQCSICNARFSIAYGGRRDIALHIETNKHKNAVNAANSHKTVDAFFKSTAPKADDLLTAAKEATFAYHTVQHDLSFKSSDCQSKLICKLFDSKFSSAKTKTEAIAINVIAPFTFDRIMAELEVTNFVTVSIDASNRLDMKLVPVVIRYYIPSTGVKNVLIDFNDVSGETAEILTDHIFKSLEKNNLLGKVISYCADNTNTNFGGVKRRGKTNVFTKLQERVGRKLLGIGCGAHIVHNCVQHGVDQLPFDVEAIVVKIYKFFYIYTVRVTDLKDFCDFVGVHYKKVLSHSSTRFLSLLPAIERILQIYDGLKSYFLSKCSSSCPKVIQEFFENPVNEILLWFLYGALQIFQETTLKMEKEDISATEVSLKYTELKEKLVSRRDNKFIPQIAKEKLSQAVEQGDTTLVEFQSHVTQFYTKCIDYLELWEGSFEGAEHFSWIRKPNNYLLEWGIVEKSAEYINSLLPSVINIDQMFDELTVVNSALKKIKLKMDESREQHKQEKKKGEFIEITGVQLWLETHKLLQSADCTCSNFDKVLEFALCLPGTSASVERIFSLMKHVWSPDRNRLMVGKVQAMLSIKVNCKMSCVEFFEDIKGNKPFLKKVLSSEKYDWHPNPEDSVAGTST